MRSAISSQRSAFCSASAELYALEGFTPFGLLIADCRCLSCQTVQALL